MAASVIFEVDGLVPADADVTGSCESRQNYRRDPLPEQFLQQTHSKMFGIKNEDKGH